MRDEEKKNEKRKWVDRICDSTIMWDTIFD